MSSHRAPDTRRRDVTRFVPTRVRDFLAQAGTRTRQGDIPLLPEWTGWAARYETLDEVWRASRSPEFLIFILGHAIRQDYLEDEPALLDGLERFVDWCVAHAQLDPETFCAPDATSEDVSRGWFSPAGASPFGRARRAARAAELKTVTKPGAAHPREFLGERAEQAAVLRLFVGNPFARSHQPEDGQVADPVVDRGADAVESDEAESEGVEGEPEQSDLLLAPAHRGPWGVVTSLVGPPDPPGAAGAAAAAARDADASLRRGMILLSKKSVEDAVAVAEECFREALSLLISTVSEMHPKVAYACDRIGLVCQIQGREEEAEAMYLRAVALRDACAWDRTLWDEVTLLNLAILYNDQGRYGIRDAMLKRLEDMRQDSQSPGDEDGSTDPDQLELA